MGGQGTELRQRPLLLRVACGRVMGVRVVEPALLGSGERVEVEPEVE